MRDLLEVITMKKRISAFLSALAAGMIAGFAQSFSL